MTRIRG